MQNLWINSIDLVDSINTENESVCVIDTVRHCKLHIVGPCRVYNVHIKAQPIQSVKCV